MKMYRKILAMVTVLMLLATNFPMISIAEEQQSLQPEQAERAILPTAAPTAEPTAAPQNEPVDYTFSLSRSLVLFDDVVVGSIYPDALKLSITNTSTVTQTLIAPSAKDFTIGTFSKVKLAAGETAAFTVAPKDGLVAGVHEEEIFLKSEEGGQIPLILSVKVNVPLAAMFEAERVILSDVSNFSVTSFSYKELCITWSPISGETSDTKYELYRSESYSGPFTLVKTLNKGTYRYKDGGLTCGTAYYYRMRAYEGSDFSSFTTISYAVVRPRAPLNLKATAVNSTSIKLTWGSVPGATGYEIFRAASATAATESIGTTSSVTYTDTGLMTGTPYFYYIRAYRTGNGTNIYSDLSTAVIIAPLPVAPATLAITVASYNSLALTWSRISDATGYKVYRSKENDSSYSEIVSQTDTTYTDTALDSGVQYYYYVTAIVNSGESVPSDIKTGIPLPLAPKGFTAVSVPTKTVRLSWTTPSSADGFDGFFIQRSITPSGGYRDVLEANADITSYVDRAVESGKTYYYRICGYRKTAGNQKVRGKYTAQVVCTVLPDMPTDLVVRNVAVDKLQILWSPVDGADGYMVYRSLSRSSGYARIADLSASSVSMEGEKCYYRNIGLTAGTVYYYRVLAYAINGSERVLGDFSAIGNNRPKPTTPTGLSVGAVGSSTVTLSWDSVYGAHGYLVYGKPYNSTDGYSVYARIEKGRDATTLRVTGLNIGVRYAFKVAAYRVVNNQQVIGGTNTTPVSAITVPSIPTLSSNSATLTTIKLSWKLVDGASGYEISRTVTGSSGPKTVLTTTSALTATVNAEAGRSYDYYARSYTIVNNTRVFSAYSQPKTLSTVPTRPAINSIRSLSQTSLRITWTCSDELLAWTKGGGFILERSNDNQSFQEVYRTNFNLSVLTWDDPNITESVVYYYRLKAYVNTDYGVKTSYYSVVKLGYTEPPAPSNLTVEPDGYIGVTLNWTAASDTDGYELFYKESSTKNFSLFARVGSNTTSYGTQNRILLKIGNTYSFRIRSYKAVGDLRYYSDYTATVQGAPELGKPSPVSPKFSASNTITVRWGAVTGADEYHVYYSNSPNGTYTFAGSVKSPARVMNVNVRSGSVYYFRVCAAKIYNGVSYEGGYKQSYICSITAPTGLSATVASLTSIKFGWKAAYGVSGYALYRRSAGSTGPYTLIANNIPASATSYTLIGVPAANKYEYVLRGYQLSGSAHNESKNSNTVSIASTTAAPKTVRASASSANSIRITWTRVSQASGYVVYYRKASSKTWTQLVALRGADTLALYTSNAEIGVNKGDRVYFRVASFYENPSTGKRSIGPTTVAPVITCK